MDVCDAGRRKRINQRDEDRMILTKEVRINGETSLSMEQSISLEGQRHKSGGGGGGQWRVKKS